jgi:hypothetical protein
MDFDQKEIRGQKKAFRKSRNAINLSQVGESNLSDQKNLAMESRVQHRQHHQVGERKKQAGCLLLGGFGRTAQKSQVPAARKLSQIFQTDPRQ